MAVAQHNRVSGMCQQLLTVCKGRAVSYTHTSRCCCFAALSENHVEGVSLFIKFTKGVYFIYQPYVIMKGFKNGWILMI